MIQRCGYRTKRFTKPSTSRARGGLKREVKEALRTGRTRRKKQKGPEERTSRFRDPMINISERPAEVQDRAIPGHWESQCFCQAA